MAHQLEVIKFRDIVPVDKITRFVPGMSELTLELVGSDFSSVDEVLINELRAPEFIILNKTLLWVQVPDGAKNQITSIEVVSSNFTSSLRGSKIQFKIGNKTRSVSGILKLTQLFTKWLLQTPGSDVFDPERGGGVQKMIGSLTTRKMEPIMAGIARAISNTTTQIREAQTSQTGLPLNERLLSASASSINIYEKEMEARVVIDIRNMAGEDAISSLQL